MVCQKCIFVGGGVGAGRGGEGSEGVSNIEKLLWGGIAIVTDLEQ